jgi:hypothetical protein
MSARANEVTDAYLAECARPGSGLRHALAAVDVTPTQRAAWPRLLPRPIMVDDTGFRAFGRDLATVFDLVTTLPQRCFDGDVDRFQAALRIDERRGALMRRLLDGGPPPRYGRADVYYDGSSFKLLEFNIGSALGGLDMVGTLPAAYLRVPAFAEFADAHRLRYLDVGADIADALRVAGKAAGTDEPVVAVLEGPGGMATYGTKRRAIAELLTTHGLECRVGEISDLTFHSGKPHLDGTPVDVILRYYALEEMLALPDGDALMEPVFRAHEEGSVVLWTPSNMYGNKATLAMLSEFAHDSAMFSTQERAVIDRVLPWSRLLGRPGGGTDADLIEECAQRQEQLVFKPTGLFGGQGVLIGREVDARMWREALTTSAESGCLVQEVVRPNTEQVIDPETGERTDWYALWAGFVTPAGLSGGGVRAVPPGGSTVITMTNNANVRNTCVFTC